MSNTEPNIKILKLKVRGEDIQYSVYDGYLDGREKSAGGDYEELKLGKLQEETIDLLIDLLQQLAVQERDRQPQDGEVHTFNRLIQVLGGHLYTVLFSGKVHDNLHKLLDKQKAIDLLRIELEFVDKGRLATWPWEYLYCPFVKGLSTSDQFLALASELILNRMLSLRPGSKSTVSTHQPIDVLVVASNPGFPKHLRGVSGDVVIQALKDLHKSGIVKIGKLHELIEPEYELGPDYDGPTVTQRKFRAVVKDKKPHIIHFIGHGRRNPEGGGGQIGLVKEGGLVDWVDDTEFAKMAEDGLPNLKLVFLQVCESALPDPYMGVSGVAQCLAHRAIPAVVAMQYKVDKGVADLFAKSFYESLASGKPVDLAVKLGRETLRDGGQYHAFGLPVVYLRSYEGMILPERAQRIPGGGGLPLQVHCPRCDTPRLQENQKICTECGLGFFCAGCGERLLNPLGNYCHSCPTKIEKPPWPPQEDAQKAAAPPSAEEPPAPLGSREPPVTDPGSRRGLRDPKGTSVRTG